MLRCIALLILVAAASGTIFTSKCQMVRGKFPFNLVQFQGTWHVAAADDNTLAEMGVCGKLTLPPITKDQNKDDLVQSGRYTGVCVKKKIPIAVETYFQPMINDKVGNLFGVSRLEGTSTFSPVFVMTIVATDYTSYALYLACKHSFDAKAKVFRSAVHASIWNRPNVTLSKDTIQTLTSVLSSYGIDSASIKAVEQNC